MKHSAIFREGGKSMRGTRFAKGIVLVLAIALVALSAGCFGKFQLTRKVYDINKSVDDKYVRSAVTWVFLIIPIYEIAALADAVVFNVIEFWTGDNPASSEPAAKVYERGDTRAFLSLSRDGSATTAVIDRYEAGILVSTLRIRDDGLGSVTAVETASGRKVREVSAVAAADGSVDVTVRTASGTDSERYAATAVRTLMTRTARIVSEAAQASNGTSGKIPLAATARVPAYGG